MYIIDGCLPSCVDQIRSPVDRNDDKQKRSDPASTDLIILLGCKLKVYPGYVYSSSLTLLKGRL